MASSTDPAGERIVLGAFAYIMPADWRQRVAGDARPGSGPAVSLGVDF
jgi:hypothetical protein